MTRFKNLILLSFALLPLCIIAQTGLIEGSVYAYYYGTAADSLRKSDVTINLLDVQDNVIATTTTNINGNYSFRNLADGSYTVSAVPSDEDYLNGISTFDLVLISKHILGVVPFESPYEIIAADVNGSGGISTFDLILIRRLILGIDQAFPNYNSWVYVPDPFEFPETTNPYDFDFPKEQSVELTAADNQHTVTFVAVKIGDVNGSGR